MFVVSIRENFELELLKINLNKNKICMSKFKIKLN